MKSICDECVHHLHVKYARKKQNTRTSWLGCTQLLNIDTSDVKECTHFCSTERASTLMAALHSKAVQVEELNSRLEEACKSVPSTKSNYPFERPPFLEVGTATRYCAVKKQMIYCSYDNEHAYKQYLGKVYENIGRMRIDGWRRDDHGDWWCPECPEIEL